MFGSFVFSALAGVAMIGSTRSGCVAANAGAGMATFVSDGATLVGPPATGCPQFVQKVVPGSSLLPQFVQEEAREGVAGTGSTAVGEATTATAGTAWVTGAG